MELNRRNRKTKSARSIDRKAVNSIFAPLVTSKYFYLAVTNTKKTKATIYRMSVKGGKLKKYAVIAPKKSTITSVSLLNDSYCGYTTGNEKYYKYTFKMKKRVKISLDELLRLQTADLYSY